MIQSVASKLFGRQQRIKTPDEFQRVYQSKQWGASQHFSFNVLALSPEKGNSRLGVTVSKKVAKQAAVRNRIKRQIREFYRQQKNTLMPVDLIINAKPSSASLSNQERRKDLRLLWKKILKWQTWYCNNHTSLNNNLG